MGRLDGWGPHECPGEQLQDARAPGPSPTRWIGKGRGEQGSLGRKVERMNVYIDLGSFEFGVIVGILLPFILVAVVDWFNR